MSTSTYLATTAKLCCYCLKQVYQELLMSKGQGDACEGGVPLDQVRGRGGGTS